MKNNSQHWTGVPSSSVVDRVFEPQSDQTKPSSSVVDRVLEPQSDQTKPSSSVVDRVFEPQSDQTKYYTFGICCFSAKLASIRSKTIWLGIRIL